MRLSSLVKSFVPEATTLSNHNSNWMVGYQKPNWFRISYTIYFLVLSVVQYYILYWLFLNPNSTLCSRVLFFNLLLVVLWDCTITGSGHTIFCASSQLGTYFTHLVPSTRMATLSGYVILYPCKFSLLNIRLFYVLRGETCRWTMWTMMTCFCSCLFFWLSKKRITSWLRRVVIMVAE